MTAFRFPLDRVLDWYRKQGTLEEERLMVLLSSLNTVTAEIAGLAAQLSDIETEILSRGSMRAFDLIGLDRFRGEVKRKDTSLRESQKLLEQKVSVQRDIVMAIRQKLRLLEKVRERRQQEHAALVELELSATAAESHLARRTAGRERNPIFNA